jgi:hypothetical protein
MSKYIDLDDERFKVTPSGYVGLGDRYWFKVHKHRSLFGKKTYSIHLITQRANKFDNFEKAVYFAKKYIADFHDLIERG